MGGLIAALGAICGIGGGLFSTPILHYGFHFQLRRAIATSLALVSATALSATVAESVRADSAIPWTVVAAIVPGALAGAQVGYRVGDRLKVWKLKLLFCIALVIVGSKLLMVSGQGAWGLDYAPDLLDHLKAALLGLAAGFVVPILGIGGGMLMVPGMLLLVPGLGFSGARATSLAVASFIASRSAFLYLREGKLDLRDGRWIALGALAGAAVGVQLAHLPEVGPTGQVLLGVILLGSALRFGLDVFRLLAKSKSPS